jgi:outer membrane lipoprotein SlyB
MFKKINLFFISLLLILTSCARDLSSDLYTSDTTMSLTLEGKVISVRAVKVSESDKLGDNKTGIAGGALAGGMLGAQGGNSLGMMAGGAIIGGLVGAGVEKKLGESKGFEYIIKVNKENISEGYYEGSPIMRNAISSARTSGIMTIVQSTKDPIAEGSDVYVIISDKRARVIAKN